MNPHSHYLNLCETTSHHFENGLNRYLYLFHTVVPTLAAPRDRHFAEHGAEAVGEARVDHTLYPTSQAEKLLQKSRDLAGYPDFHQIGA